MVRYIVKAMRKAKMSYSLEQVNIKYIRFLLSSRVVIHGRPTHFMEIKVGFLAPKFLCFLLYGCIVQIVRYLLK
jgi:hypothetical protein